MKAASRVWPCACRKPAKSWSTSAVLLCSGSKDCSRMRSARLVEQFGLCILPLLGIDKSQIVQRIGHPEMFWSQLLLADAQCLLVEWLGLRILPLLGIDKSQSVQQVSLLGVRPPSPLLPHSHRLLVEQPCLR